MKKPAHKLQINKMPHFQSKITDSLPIHHKSRRILAKVSYKEQRGKVVVVGLRNFYTPVAIAEKYGERVTELYLGTRPYMHRYKDGIYLKIRDTHIIVGMNSIFTPQLFNTIIENMRACGKRLGDIIKEESKKVHHIEI